MMTNPSIQLFDPKLILENNKCIYETRVLYDFNDRYANLSFLGVEQQHDLFKKVMSAISNASISDATKSTIILCYIYFIKILSTKNTPVRLICIGFNIGVNIFEGLLKSFHPQSTVLSYEHSNAQDAANASMGKAARSIEEINCLSPEANTITIINVDSIPELTVLLQTNQVFFASVEYMCYIGNGRFTAQYDPSKHDVFNLCNNTRYIMIAKSSAQISRSGHLAQASRFKSQLIAQLDRLYVHMLAVLAANDSNNLDEWHIHINSAIEVVDEIETVSIPNIEDNDSEHLKYETNELKNMLLDLKYEAKLDKGQLRHFSSTLAEHYNSWIQSFDAVH